MICQFAPQLCFAFIGGKSDNSIYSGINYPILGLFHFIAYGVLLLGAIENNGIPVLVNLVSTAIAIILAIIFVILTSVEIAPMLQHDYSATPVGVDMGVILFEFC